MKKVSRLDYLDIQIYCGRDSVKMLPQTDIDGATFLTTLITHDSLSYEIFELLEIPFSSSSWGNKTLYQAKTKEVYIASGPRQKSLQFKGLFFLRKNANQLIRRIVAFLKSKQISFSVSRIDLSYILTDPKIFKSFDSCDFKNLTIYSLKKKELILYKNAYSSRINFLIYKKSTQITQEKDELYHERFLSFYELIKIPSDLLNLEIRLLGSDSCKAISEELINGFKMNEIKKIIIDFIKKRIGLKKNIEKLILETSIYDSMEDL